MVKVSKGEIAQKIRRIGEYSMLIQNRYVIVLFHFTATDDINRRVIETLIETLKEIKGLAKSLLDNVDELLRELGEEQ